MASLPPGALDAAQLALVTSYPPGGTLLAKLEVCRILAISDDKLDDMVEAGEFASPLVYPGNLLRWRAEDVWAYKLLGERPTRGPGARQSPPPPPGSPPATDSPAPAVNAGEKEKKNSGRARQEGIKNIAE